MFADNVIHFTIFLGEGYAQIAVSKVAHIDQILLAYRLVEAVFHLKVLANFRSHRFGTAQWIAGNCVHREESGGCDKPHGYQPLDQAFESVKQHDNRLFF